MNTRGSEPVQTVIVLARDQASLYEFLKPRQEVPGGTIVILDRREPRGEDGGPPDGTTGSDDGQLDRRGGTPEAALALLSVLGFMVLHREGERWTP